MKTLIIATAAFLLGALAMYSVHSALDAGEASKNKRSLAEARNILDAIERYRAATGDYPPVDRGIPGLARYLVPKFAPRIWPNDIYGRPYIVFLDRSGAAVVSTGRNGFVVHQAKAEQTMPEMASTNRNAPAEGPYRVSNKVHAPIATRRVEPDFSKCKGKYSGSPALEVVILRDGSLSNFKVTRAVDPCIDAAFVSAVRQWQFRPGTLEGKPVDVTYAVTAHINYR